ncbi:uncharacterized protein METZ01_LOCUS329645 [marine metagenome]|uniref:Uncharacterized protein n=1 Tax=marine metagenome TaxID=408172 RepID=A0A382PXT0_9ZZZZ
MHKFEIFPSKIPIDITEATYPRSFENVILVEL